MKTRRMLLSTSLVVIAFVLLTMFSCGKSTSEKHSDGDDTGINIENGMALIPAGAFTMGSPGSEEGRDSDETLHRVTLTHPFRIGTTCITDGQWKGMMGWNPSYFPSCGDDCPVEQVTWFDTLAYANQASTADGFPPCYVFADVICENGDRTGSDYMACTKTRPPGINYATITLNGAASPYECAGYRLPTEAEWEYATRAGTTTAYSDGLESDAGHLVCEAPFHLTDIAWYCADSSITPHPVGTKVPNAWGLYDTSGNVVEWVWDWYGEYTGDVTDPTGPSDGSGRVIRGGGWSSLAFECRSAFRMMYEPVSDVRDLGFRLTRTAS